MSAQPDFFGDHARSKAEQAAARLAELARAYRCTAQGCPSKGPFYGFPGMAGRFCKAHSPSTQIGARAA